MEDNVKVYLGKVLDRLKKGTPFEIRDGEVYWAFPYPQSNLSPAGPYHSNSTDSHFYNHCRELYGLTNREIRYVWDRYYEWLVNEIAEKKPISRYNTFNG